MYADAGVEAADIEESSCVAHAFLLLPLLAKERVDNLDARAVHIRGFWALKEKGKLKKRDHFSDMRTKFGNKTHLPNNAVVLKENRSNLYFSLRLPGPQHLRFCEPKQPLSRNRMTHIKRCVYCLVDLT
jgi:hypothetical protein